MDPVVGASIITAGASVTVAILQTWRAGRADRARKATESALQQIGKGVAIEAAYTIEKVEVEVKFDDTGRGVEHKRWMGLRCNQDIQNLQVPFEFAINSPAGKIESIAGGELDNSALTVGIKEQERNDRSSRGIFVANGRCGPDSRPVSFFLKWDYTGAHCLTRAEAEEAYHDDAWTEEYVSNQVMVPLGELVITVMFPDSHEHMKPPPRPVVFIGGTETVLHQETKRVEDSFSVVERTATLRVSAPKIGLGYAISWMPPR